MQEESNKFGKKRSEKYNNIGWTADKKLLKAIYDFLDFRCKNSGENILEVGIGTGVVSDYIFKREKDIKIFGVDNSQEMIDSINNEKIKANTYYGSAWRIPFNDRFFSAVYCRNILHHLSGKINLTIKEMNRVLTNRGTLVLCDAIPISPKCVSDFANIVCLKENRLVFNEEDMIRMLFGLNNIESKIVILKHQSIMNWLENCVFSKKLKRKIWNAHLGASGTYKKLAHMEIENGDIFVDMKFCIVKGRK